MFLTIYTLFVLLLSYFPFQAHANTEIINFYGPTTGRGADVPLLVSHWPILNKINNERQLNITPAPLGTPLKTVCESGVSGSSDSGANFPRSCPHELWIALDFEGWDTYEKFTLRLSWPASFPSDFLLEIYDSEALVVQFPREQTLPPKPVARQSYARIRSVDTGIRTPTPEFRMLSSRGIPPASNPVPIIIILEPLYYAILPASVTPVLGFMIMVSILASFAVPKINSYLQSVALRAKQEILESQKKEE